MANKLKIYACSGVGDTAHTETFDYWKDNVNVLKNTQAVNALSAEIEGIELEAQNETDKTRKSVLMDQLDLCAVCLYYAQEYSGNVEALEKAAAAIGSVINSGAFICESTDNTERDRHLDALFEKVADSFGSVSEHDNPAFDEWWQTHVIDLDHVGMTEEQQKIFNECLQQHAPKKAKRAKKNANTADPLQDENIGEYLTKSGNYFLYLFFTQEQLAKLPKVFTIKYVNQRRVYEWAKTFYIGVYGNEAAMLRVIRNGIYKEYNASPEEVCAGIASGKRKESVGVVDWITIVCTIIQALVTFLVGYFVALYDYKARVEIAENQAIDKAILENNVPEDTDFDDMETSGWKKYAWVGAVGLGLLMLLKK